MLNPLIKIILRPIATGLIAQMDRLIHLINSDQKEEAIKTVQELRVAIQTAKDKYL